VHRKLPCRNSIPVISIAGFGERDAVERSRGEESVCEFSIKAVGADVISKVIKCGLECVFCFLAL
jgi:hypothetical protein